MSDDQRVRAAVVDLVDAIEVPPATGAPSGGHAVSGTGVSPTPIDARRAARDAAGADGRRAPRRRSRVVWQGVAAAVVLVVALVSFGLLRSTPRPDPVTSGAAPVFPATLPEYRPWGWWPQAWRPVDAVAMTWYVPDPSEMTLIERPHDMLLGSDLETIRADDRGWTPVVSPNGRRLARLTDGGDVRIDDLVARSSVGIPVPGGGEWAELQPWSADSDAVYVQARDVEASAFALLEIRLDGTTRTVAQLPHVVETAPAPDGRRVAIVAPRRAVQILDTTSARVVDTLDWEGQGTRRAITGLQWSPDGRQILIFMRENTSVPGVVVTIIDTGSGRRRTVRSPGFSCDPLVMLTAERVLCLSSATTRPGVPSSNAPAGLVTYDLGTGERRVVTSAAEANPPVGDVSIAADLARRWQFATSRPWVAPVHGR